MRGNVDTRLGKLRSGDLDAIVLALAGLRRLGREARVSEVLAPTRILPAIGQGALGLEVKGDNERILRLLGFMNHAPTQWAVTAERAFLKELQGGCQVPIAGYARLEGGRLHLMGMVAALDGSRVIRDEIRGDSSRAEAMGVELARRMLSCGADRILAAVYPGFVE